MKKYYAGIGSRRIPESVRSLIAEVARFLWADGYALRSGGAPGADQMFEEGHSYDDQEIYLPWRRFENNPSHLYIVKGDAIELSARYYHSPDLTAGSWSLKQLMGRNAYQVLGQDLKTKSDFLVVWTPNGQVEGGTGQAMRIAAAYGIKIYNLNAPGCSSFEAFMRWYKQNNFDIL